MRPSPVWRWAEGFGSGALIALLGLLRPADPFFKGLGFLPQALVAVVMAALLGAAPGCLALAGSLLASLALPALPGLLGGLGIPDAGPAMGHGPSMATSAFMAARLPLAATLVGVLSAGLLRDSDLASRHKLLERIRSLTHRSVKLEKVTDSLSSLCEELERRVAGQRDSISALAFRIKRMDSLDLDKVLAGLLEAVAAFSQASSAAVYEYDPNGKRLLRQAFIGEEPAASLPIEGSVEGWVFRNDSFFSLRQLEDYLNLGRADTSHNVLAYPLKAGDLPWGVVNIAEMPFYRYNPVTEKNLSVVLELASSYIRKASDFRDRVLSRPRNEVTGMPGYGELLRILGDELARRASRQLSVSVVIVELLGFEDIVFHHSGAKAFGLLKDFVAKTASGHKAMAFHYREDGQVAFVLPDLDRGGASLFCLDLTAAASESLWKIDGSPVCFETAFGLSAFPTSLANPEILLGGGSGGAAAGAPPAIGSAPASILAPTPEALLAEAENVLSLQKRVYQEHGGSCP
jgi:hypothetical protein